MVVLCSPGYVAIMAQLFVRPALWFLVGLLYRMPGIDGAKGLSLARPAMSSSQPPLRLEAGTYDAASSQKRERGSGRSKSLRRQVSQKAEASSDNITMVYRALRVEESPTKLRKVLPDTKDYSIWSLHMFPCAFLFGLF